MAAATVVVIIRKAGDSLAHVDEFLHISHLFLLRSIYALQDLHKLLEVYVYKAMGTSADKLEFGIGPHEPVFGELEVLNDLLLGVHVDMVILESLTYALLHVNNHLGVEAISVCVDDGFELVLEVLRYLYLGIQHHAKFKRKVYGV
jgi:hypothetical protein